MDTVSEGWGHLDNTYKWHYWAEGDVRSLCRKWGYFRRPELGQGGDDSPDNCAACAKRLAKRKAKNESSA
jgi:hypothetical protein